MYIYICTYFICVVHYAHHTNHDSKKKDLIDDKELGDLYYSTVGRQIETIIKVYACIGKDYYSLVC